MNLETTVQRQVELNYTLKSLTQQLEVITNKIAGEKNEEMGIDKPKFQPNGIIDELQYLQENSNETLQEVERLLRRLSEATWQPSMPIEMEYVQKEYPVSN